jgi:ComF family protein
MLKETYNFIIKKIIAPPFCRACQIFLSHDDVLCAECHAGIAPLISTEVFITPKYSCKVFAVGKYEDPLKPLILAKSWSDRSASHQLGQLVWEKTYIRHQEFDFIVPVPLHWTRFSYRGFNQAQELAQVLAHKSGKPVLNALTRTRRTPFQSAVSAAQREANVNRVFALNELNKEQLKDKHILLVDDLMTTGATLKSAARELIRCKPASIKAVVVCRT